MEVVAFTIMVQAFVKAFCLLLDALEFEARSTLASARGFGLKVLLHQACQQVVVSRDFGKRLLVPAVRETSPDALVLVLE